MNRKKPIHKSVKIKLGYAETDTDKEVISDWNDRLKRVCKPCWELKYCPYGPLVEQSPTLPSLRKDADEKIQYFRECISLGLVGNKYNLSDEQRRDYEEWLEDEETLFFQSLYEYQHEKRLEYASSKESDEEKINAWIGGELPPIHEYRIQFHYDQDTKLEDLDSKIQLIILEKISKLREKYRRALATGEVDNRTPLEPARRAWFEMVVANHVSDDLPEEIPNIFYDGVCNVFGHVCPVFFAAEALTETQEERKLGRRVLSFSSKMRIVRRDNYTCQECGKHLNDDEVEFDHIIPVSKGGSSEEYNMRLTCYDCNRDKSDSFSP